MDGGRRPEAEAGSTGAPTRRAVIGAAIAGGLAAAQLGGVATASAATPRDRYGEPDAPTGAAGASTAARPPVLLGRGNDAGSRTTGLTADLGDKAATLDVVNPDTAGTGLTIRGRLGHVDQAVDLSLDTRAAVLGQGAGTSGVTGMSDSATGTTGYSRTGIGVHGSGGQTGVVAESTSGTAVLALTEVGTAVDAQSNAGTAVSADAFLGPAVVATSSDGAAIVARSAKNAVDATSSSGYGVHAAGAVAPLRLEPAATKGPPAPGNTHQVGEFWVDRTGALFFCVAAGNPGIWKKVTLS